MSTKPTPNNKYAHIAADDTQGLYDAVDAEFHAQVTGEPLPPTPEAPPAGTRVTMEQFRAAMDALDVELNAMFEKNGAALRRLIGPRR